MRVKVEAVHEGIYGYDAIVVLIDKQMTEIVFKKGDNVKKYEGQFVELINNNGRYTIQEIKK